MPAADTAKLIAELTLKDNLSKGVRSATTSLGKLDKATSRTQKSLGTLGANLTKGAVIGAAAAAGGFVAVVNSARDFESAFAGVRKTVDATEPELNALSDAIRQMSREIPISAVELAGLGEAAGALGIAKGDIQEFIRVTALIGVTTDVAAGDAATALGGLSNILGLVSADYDNFASTLVDLGNKGASTESEILAFTQRIAGAGSLIGLSADQVLGYSAALANARLEAEAGGTAISKFFLESFEDVTKGGKDLKLLAKLAGTTAKAFQKAFKKDAAGALEDVLVGLGKLNEGQRLAAIEALGFTDVRIRDTLLRLTGDTANLTNSLDTSAKSWKENTALTIEAKKRFETFDSQLVITKQVLNDVAITVGSKLLPKLTPLLQKLNAFVNQNQGKIEEFGTRLAGGFEDFATAVGKVDWQPFIDGLRITSDIAKSAVGLFMSLPPDVQKIAIAALAVNKVTGGLGSSIIKDLAGLALGSLKTITAANVTVIGANVVGGGVPGGAAAAGGGGLLATGAAVAAPVLTVAAVAIAAKAIQDRIDTQGAGLVAQAGVFAKDATSAELASAIDGIKKQLASTSFNTFDQKNKIVDTLNVLIAEQNKRADMGAQDADKANAVAERRAAAAAAAEAKLLGSTTKLDTTTRSQLGGVIAQVQSAKAAGTTAAAQVAAAARNAGSSVSSAVERKRLAVTVNNSVSTFINGRKLVGTLGQQTFKSGVNFQS